MAVNVLLGAPEVFRKSTVALARKTLPKSVREWGNRHLESPEANARRYFATGHTVESFFETLQKRNINYVILRWFEDLPSIEPGEDIDILVADEDLPRIADLFGNDKTQQICDVYSVTGLAGSNFSGLPYYPPQLAQEILRTRRWHKSLFAVPDEKHHFLSLAYHLLFHKGKLAEDHDYLATLKAIKPEDITTPLDSFSAIDYYLQKHGWLPELDTLRKLASRSRWALQRLGESVPTLEHGDIMVFIVREWANTAERMERISALLRAVPLEILHVWEFDCDAKARARQAIRGGNWNRGTYRGEGGDPCAMIVCFDYHPSEPGEASLEEFPYLQNAHYLCKHAIRDSLNRCELLCHQANFLHSADDFDEALEYVRAVYPERTALLAEERQERNYYFSQEHEVLSLLSTHRTRAKVEKVSYKGRPALKKTFKPGNARFLQRELLVHSELSKSLDCIPPLLDQGENFMIVPWYDDVLATMEETERNNFLNGCASSIIRILQFFYDQGFALVDFHPGNLLYSADEGLKVVDFEFLYRYPQKPASFLASFDMAGLPPEFHGDLPSGHTKSGRTYNNTWKPILGPLSEHIDKQGNPQ